MPRDLRIFISSPGDVPAERLRADLIVDRLAQDYSRFLNIKSYRWEHEPMLASGHFQDAIEPPSQFDIVVLILWSRLGSALPIETALRKYQGIDGRTPVTGTEWEYEEALQAARERGAPDILAFRNVSPAAVDSNDAVARARAVSQLDALDGFWRRHFADRGLFLAAFEEYRTIDQFAGRLYESLRRLIDHRITSSADDRRSVVWTEEPFRGLAAYEFEHAAIYFGRDGLVAKAAHQLAERARAGPAFLLVSGASGSGKSSLVKAALVPALMKPQRVSGAAFLRRAIFRPSDSKDLVAGLADCLVRGSSDDVGLPELLGPGQTSEDLAAYLRGAAASPGFAFAHALGRLTDEGRKDGRLLAYEEAKLLLVIDQLEELYTIAEITDEQRAAFVKLIGGLARSGSVWIVATIRSDFWHRIAESPELLGLAEALGRLDISMPSPAELSEIIRKPAEAAGLSFEIDKNTGLGLDAILAEHAANAPGVLPLLSFTLDELYRRDVGEAGGRQLTYATYESLGQLQGAIATRADEIVSELPEAVQNALPRVLRALTTVSRATDTVAVARSVPVDNLSGGAPTRKLVDVLTAARLLVAATDGKSPTIRLAHEALISRWKRARDQLSLDRRDLETRDLIEQQQGRWSLARGRAQRQLLLRDPDLANAIDLEKRLGDELQPLTRTFIQNSRRRARAQQQLLAAAAVVFGIVALLAAFAAQQAYTAKRLASERGELAELKSKEAIDAQQRAETAKDQAQVSAAAATANERNAILAARRAQRSESSTLAERSLRETASGNIAEGLRTALQALPGNLEQLDRPFEPRAEFALAKAMLADRLLYSLAPTKDKINTAALSPDNSLIATGTRDGVITLWNRETGKEVRHSTERKLAVFGLAFSPDGKWLVSSHQEPMTVILWNVQTGEKLWEQRAPGNMSNLFFTPDGKQIVAIADAFDTRPRILDASNGRILAVLERDVSGLNSTRSVALSPSGKYLVALSYGLSGSPFVMWSMETGKPLASKGSADYFDFSKFEERESLVWAGFVGGSDTLALRGNKRIYLVNPQKREITSSFAFADSWHLTPDATAVAADGKTIALATTDTDISLFAMADGKPLAKLTGNTSKLRKIAFSPDGLFVIGIGEDCAIRLWQSTSGTLLATLRGHKQFAIEARFMPDSARLLSFGDEVARVWDVRPDNRRWLAVPDGPGWELAEVDAIGRYALAKKRGPAEKDSDYAPETAIGLWDIAGKTMVRSFEIKDGESIDIPNDPFSPAGDRAILKRRFFREGTEHAGELKRLSELAKQPEGPPLEGKENAFYEIINAKTGESEGAIRLSNDSRIDKLAWSRDGSLLVGSGYDYGDDDKESKAFVDIWDLSRRKLLLELTLQGSDPAVLFAEDKSTIEVTTRLKRSSDYVVTLWNLADGKKIFEKQLKEPAVTALPGSDRFVLAGPDAPPSLRAWKNGDALATISGEYVGTASVRIRHDEQRMVIQRNNAPLSLWDTKTAKLIGQIPEQPVSWAQAFGFSGDGRRLLSNAYNDRKLSVQVTDVETGQKIRSLGPFDNLNGIGFGYSGRYVFVNSQPKDTAIYAADASTPGRALNLKGAPHRWRFAAGDQRLLIADQGGNLQIFETATGKLVKLIDGVDRQEPLQSDNEPINLVGILMANGGAAVLDTLTGNIVWNTAGTPSVERLQISPNAQFVAVVRTDRVEFVGLPDGAKLGSVPIGNGDVKLLQFIGDGNNALIHGEDHNTVLFSGRERRILQTYAGNELATAIADNAVFILGNGSDLRSYDARTGELKQTVGLAEPVSKVTQSVGSSRAVASTKKGTVYLIDFETGQSRKVASFDGQPKWIYPVGASQLLVDPGDDVVALWNAETGKRVTDFPVKWPANAAKWLVRASRNAAYVAVKSSDEFVRIFRTNDGTRASYFNWSQRRIIDFAFNQDGSRLLALSDRGELAFWDVAAGKSEASVSVPGKFGYNTKLFLAASGAQIIIIDEEGVVNVVSILNRTVQRLVPSQARPLEGVSISDDGTLLATYQKGTGLCVWQLGISEVLFATRSGWKDEDSYDVTPRFSKDGRFVMLEDKYEATKVFRLPSKREQLIKASMASIAFDPADPDGKPRTPPSKLRLGTTTATSSAGALVTELVPDSAAVDAGLQVGDVITQLNDVPVRNPGELRDAVNNADGMRPVQIHVLRGGQKMTLSTTFRD